MKHFVGISWFILGLFISSVNDTIARYLSIDISPLQISFFRFLFGTLSLVPFICYKGSLSIKTSRPMVHIIRGTLLTVSIFLWIKGLGNGQVVTATIISFTIPIFLLIMAPIFLKEKLSMKLWFFAIFGLIGIIVTLNPHSVNLNINVLLLVIAAILFASLDIINKKYIIKETMLSMLFYSSVTTTLLSLIPVLIHIKSRQPLIMIDLLYLIVLGAGNNLVLFCLLNTFYLIKVSKVAPFRYLELLISILLGYFVFKELPTTHTYLGALIIINSSLYIVQKSRKSDSTSIKKLVKN